MGIEFYVVPHFQQGRPRPRNQTVQRGQRGRVSIREEHDPERHRTVRVARFEPCGAASAAVVLPPLFDAEVLACTGEWMSVAGFERVAAGPLQDQTWFAQSWWLVPAAGRRRPARPGGSRRRSRRLHRDVQSAAFPGRRRPAVRPYGVEVVDPDRFIVNQWDLDPLVAMAAFKRMRARWKRPQATPEDFAHALERGGCP